MRRQPIHESNVLAEMFICIILSLCAFHETRVLNNLHKYMHIINFHLGSYNSQCLTLICLGQKYFLGIRKNKIPLLHTSKNYYVYNRRWKGAVIFPYSLNASYSQF